MHLRAALVLLMALLGACRYGYDAEGALELADAGSTDAAAPDATCVPGPSLDDDFSAAAIDPRWGPTSAGGGEIALVNGRLRLSLPDASDALASAGLTTNGGYDFTGRRLSIQVPVMVSTSTHAQAFFQLFDVAPDPQHIVAFEQQNGTLHLYVTGPGAVSQTSVPYDPVEHRYWQLREAGGTFFLETSPDGATWTTRFSSPVDFDLTQTHLQILVGTYQPEVAPGAAELDDLVGTVGACEPR